MKYRFTILMMFVCLLATLTGLYPSQTHAVSVELLKPADYDTWEPINKGTITITVKVSGLHDRTEGFSEGTVTLNFSEITSWIGICMNYPNKMPKSENDLRFYPKDQEPLPDGMNWIPEEWNTLVGAESTGINEGVVDEVGFEFTSKINTDTFSVPITIRCEDYGAYGLLLATLVDSLDDTRTWTAERTVPKDDNGDYIADSWKKDEWNGANGHIPPADSEEGPTTNGGQNRVETNTHIGDGLVVFEEYRGFMVGGGHKRLCPKKKDIFVYSDYARFNAKGLIKSGIGAAYKLPDPFHVHEILKSETQNEKADRSINFNVLGSPVSFRPKGVNEYWQSMWKQAIWVEADDAEKTHFGYSHGDGTISIYTKPIARSVTSIGNGENHLGFAEWLARQVDKKGNQLNATDAVTDYTIGHEIGHTIRLNHPWDLALNGAVPQIPEAEQTELDALDFENDPHLRLATVANGWIGIYAFDNRDAATINGQTPEQSIGALNIRLAAYNAWNEEENNAVNAYSEIIRQFNALPDNQKTEENRDTYLANAKQAAKDYRETDAYQEAVQKRRLYWQKQNQDDPNDEDNIRIEENSTFALRLHTYSGNVTITNGPFTYTYGSSIMDYWYPISGGNLYGIYVETVYPAFHNWEYDLGVIGDHRHADWKSASRTPAVPDDDGDDGDDGSDATPTLTPSDDLYTSTAGGTHRQLLNGFPLYLSEVVCKVSDGHIG